MKESECVAAIQKLSCPCYQCARHIMNTGLMITWDGWNMSGRRGELNFVMGKAPKNFYDAFRQMVSFVALPLSTDIRRTNMSSSYQATKEHCFYCFDSLQASLKDSPTPDPTFEHTETEL